jgi:tetratricopeptide (TPR) repeat protein
MEKVGRTYRLPCTANGLPLNFILDTGADEVSISLSEALFMLKNGYIDENDLLNTEYYQLANGEIVEGTKLVLRTLKIGGLTIKNVEASIVHTMNAPLLLGQSALSKLGKITIDYAKNQLIINGNQEVYATQKGTALDYFLLGNESFTQGKFSVAIEYYSKAIEIDRNYSRAYYNRGTALSKLKDHNGAIGDYNKAIELNRDYADAYYNRGNSKKALSDYQGAITDYTKVIELDSNEIKAYFNRGNSFESLEKYDLAIEDYSKYIELDSNDKSAYLNRGNSFFSLDKYDLAIKDYSKTIEIDKKNLLAYYNRGIAKMRQRKFEDAIIDFSTTIMIDANYTTAYFYRGLVNSIINKNKEAIIDFNKAIELDNKNDYYYYYRGLAFYDFGDQNKACSDWKTALAEGYQGAEKMIEKYCGETFVEVTGTADSYYKLAESKFSNNKFSEALSFYKKVLNLDSSFFIVYKKIGICHTRLQNFEEAILNLSISLKYFYQDKEIYFLRGRAKYELGKNFEAIEDYNQALNFDSKYDFALFNRGLVNFKLNKKEQACLDWSLALELGMKKAAELIKENCE